MHSRPPCFILPRGRGGGKEEEGSPSILPESGSTNRSNYSPPSSIKRDRRGVSIILARATARTASRWAPPQSIFFSGSPA